MIRVTRHGANQVCLPSAKAHKLMSTMTAFLCGRLFGGKLHPHPEGLAWTVDERQQVCMFCDGTRFKIVVPFRGDHADVELFALVKKQSALDRGIDLGALAKQHGVVIAATSEHLHSDSDIVLRSRIRAYELSDESLEEVFLALFRCSKALEEALYGVGTWHSTQPVSPPETRTLQVSDWLGGTCQP